MLGSKHLVPSRIEETIRRRTLQVLAQKHVEQVRTMFEEDVEVKDKRRKYLAVILRDCPEQGVKTEKAHMDYLLELCT